MHITNSFPCACTYFSYLCGVYINFCGCQTSAPIARLKTPVGVLVASLLTLGYDATASSNRHAVISECCIKHFLPYSLCGIISTELHTSGQFKLGVRPTGFTFVITKQWQFTRFFLKNRHESIVTPPPLYCQIVRMQRSRFTERSAIINTDVAV